VWLHLAVYGVHVLGAIAWMGAFIAFRLFVAPALRVVPPDARVEMDAVVGRRAKRIFPPMILGMGIAGILLGTVFGPIRSLEELLGTPYGLTWLAAIVFGLLAFYPLKPRWMQRLRAEEIGFFGAFGCMVLMHFGL
jgi:putative copper export protein